MKEWGCCPYQTALNTKMYYESYRSKVLCAECRLRISCSHLASSVLAPPDCVLQRSSLNIDFNAQSNGHDGYIRATVIEDNFILCPCTFWYLRPPVSLTRPSGLTS